MASPARRTNSKKAGASSPRSQVDIDRAKREQERRERDAERARQRLEAKNKTAEIKETISQRKQMRLMQRGGGGDAIEEQETLKMRQKILGYRRERARTLANVDESKGTDDDNKAQENEVAPPQETEEPANQSSEQEVQTEEVETRESAISRDSTYLAVGEEAEVHLFALEEAFRAADPDFYGSLTEELFIAAFEESKRPLELTREERSQLFRRCVVPGDEGIDYYQFLMIVRVQALTDGGSLISVLQQMALQQSSNDDQRDSDSYEDDGTDAPSRGTMQRPVFGNAHSRQTSVISFASVRNLDPNNPLATLIDDLALDGADIDIALIRTAFQMIDVNPDEDDLEVIFNYLDTDGTGWVDFRYFLQFLQEAHDVEAAEFDLEVAVSEVATQLRIFLRNKARRDAQDQKLRARLERRRVTKQKDGLAEDLADLQKEERRMAALRARDRVRQYR